MGSRKKRRNANYDEEHKSKKGWKVIAFLLFVLLIFVYYQVYVLYRYTMGKNVTERQMLMYKWMTNAINRPSYTDEAKEGTMAIGIAGNITMPETLINSSSEEESGFDSIFKNAIIADYDYTIGSLNTAVLNNDTYDDNSAPEALLKEIRKIGFDVLITATEHLAQKESGDVRRTLNNIEKYELVSIGIKEDNSKKTYYILEKDGIKIAILAYVGEDYVNTSKNDLINVYSKKQLDSDLKKIKSENVNGIILFIDTLRSNNDSTNKTKKENLKEILNKGIDLIVSSDTIIQKNYEKDGKTCIEYSLGDFIGKQENENSDVSKFLKVTVSKEIEKSKVKVTFNVEQDKFFVALSNADKSKYKIVNLKKEINSYDEGKTLNITPAEYNYLKEIQKKYDK